MTGLVAALRLAEKGLPVDLYEARNHIGGLSDAYSWNGVTWDRFYHVVLSSDIRLVQLIRESGLCDELFWKETKSGFYGDGKLVSMSGMGDFLRFPFLSLWQKFRLGMGILTSIGLKDPDKLDRIYVREWLTKVFGRRVYEKIWDPLLRSKLGEARHKTSAAFIWATITRLYGARSGEDKTEKMGHVKGGYSTILNAMERKLHDLGVRIHTNTKVDSVVSKKEGAGSIEITAGGKTNEYDRALLTIPAPEVLRLCRKNTKDGDYWKALAEVQYLGVLCLFVVLDRKLSPFYVTNLLDTSLPFTGIIEVTNIIEPDDIEGHHLVYLPKYLTQDDPLLSASDQEVTERFLLGLRKVYPDLPPESIRHTKLFRERYVQPLQEVNYLDRTRGIETPIPGVYLANSTMLYNSTLNNNAAIELVEKAVAIMT
jgi:protoporphyrinogen oxidase